MGGGGWVVVVVVGGGRLNLPNPCGLPAWEGGRWDATRSHNTPWRN